MEPGSSILTPVGKTVGISEARATFYALLDEVAAGESVTITRRGRPVVRLEPILSPASFLGRYRGQAWQTVSDEEFIAPIRDWLTGWDWTSEPEPDRT